jgi:adenine C2-methylase RlmN of 23S rRNA A2503 and tRNA A37
MSEVFNDLIPKFNISTIMPKTLGNRKLSDIFGLITPTIYYSLYSLEEDFRIEWIPQGMDTDLAFKNLKDYQRITKKIIKFHQTLIENVNDSFENAVSIAAKIQEYKLLSEYQIVRYNSFSDNEGKESSEEHIEAWITQMDRLLVYSEVKILNRVGHDVNASCGMFYV